MRPNVSEGRKGVGMGMGQECLFSKNGILLIEKGIESIETIRRDNTAIVQRGWTGDYGIP